ncbi:complement C3-like isoform X3 [Gouania willdenowi]|nr:complement C3-like isoform X3 [Gouania willdenowi]
MSWSLLLLASLALVSLGDGAPLKIMSAPNLLRVGTTENIFVECQGCSGGDIPVTISIWNHPTNTIELKSTSVVLNSSNDYQEFGKITLPPNSFNPDPKVKQYVYLKAQFDDRLLQKVVLVTFQSGYIFIQTDKPLYTPDSTVLFRVFALTPQMTPLERTVDGGVGTSIDIDIETPDGIVLPQTTKTLKSGIHAGNYYLPDLVTRGVWKLVARFQTNPQQSFYSNFEVKEYVLPSLEVKLEPVVSFFQVDSTEFTVNIRARYLFGEKVDGTAFVVFGAITNKKRKTFPRSLQRVTISKGVGEVTLQRDHITQIFNNTDSLVGDFIFVSVSVLTKSGSEMVEAELTDIKIVKSPYFIQFTRTPKYFKPGMTFDVMVKVTNPDETPAAGITVVVNPGEEEGISDDNGIARLSVKTGGSNDRLVITAKTMVPGLSQEKQASAQLTASSYTTKSSSYIHIGVETSKLEVGNTLKISLSFNKQLDLDITYLILSKGQLVKSGREKLQGQVLIPVNIRVTKEMLPSFRIVAYYHLDDTEVVSDSVWVNVKDSCMGSLTLEVVDPPPFFLPGKPFEMKVTGDPGAKVGLVAVDKGVYVLNNKFRLTQKKVWDEVEKYDTGCTPGGGKDSMGVFYDAGLVFETSSVPGTPYRQELKCADSEKPRSKRAVTIMEVTTSLVNKYENSALQTDCCLDGMRETPLSYNCNRRSKYIVDGKACVDAFLDCCEQMRAMLDAEKQNSFKLARTETKGKYMDSRRIDVRSNFEESWLWNDYSLPACPSQTPHCQTTSFTRQFYLQDSITTWVLTGISLSSTNGICVSQSLEVIARKEFFIDLKLPYSAVRYEQLEIRAIIHNYARDPVLVKVELVENPKVCSLASKRGKHDEEIEIGARTSVSVPFVIIPMEIGELDIVVKAAVSEHSISDGVKKVLRVVSEGVFISDPKIISLDPVNKGQGGIQTVVFNSQIPKTDLVQFSPHNVLISVTGTEDGSEMVENAISGKSMGTLITQPTGCGEQNMIGMTLPVIATMYLDTTNQWEAVGLERREEALQHITTGYTSQLKYRNNDGSFSMWKNQPKKKSSWLTAYVVKVFSMAYNLVKIQPENICDSVKFLILQSQLPDGTFREIGELIHKEMVGDIHGLDSDASMTAFSLISLQESKTICSQSISSLPERIDKSVAYLEKRLPSLTNPYAVALASYALANNNKLNREVLFRFISPELTHWPVPRGPLYTMEATAYALLALVRAKAFKDAGPIVRWFSTQQAALGGYGSTQATIMVYQAVAEYWANAKEPEYNLNVEILSEGKSLPIKYNFNRKNHFTTRTSKVNSIFDNITVTASGTGEANVKMVSLYYAKPSKRKSDCRKFNMSIELIPEIENDDSVYKLRIEVLYLDKTHDSKMTILDIGLLTGYTVDTKDLELLSSGRDRTIAHYKMDKLLSERGSLIIYLDKVSHTLADEISFRIHKTIKAALLQPAVVSVYEYYNGIKCVKFYHPMRDSGNLLLLDSGKVKTCAEEDCSMQKKGNIDNRKRKDKICETSVIEFAYNVKLEETDQKEMTDINIMRIMDVIKGGNIDPNPADQQRLFISYIRCRNAINLQKNQTYLIMGSNKDVTRIEDTQVYQYVLGERTWIEYWPTDEECLDRKYRPTCLDLKKLINVTEDFRCNL